MTHEELLQKINEMQYEDYKGIGAIPDWPYQVIRAVVELHRPDEEALCLECSLELNGIMQWAVTWPCLTIQAIEKELI